VRTDKVDSTTLAHLLRSDLLSLSHLPEKQMRLNRELLRYWVQQANLYGDTRD